MAVNSEPVELGVKTEGKYTKHFCVNHFFKRRSKCLRGYIPQTLELPIFGISATSSNTQRLINKVYNY